MSEEEIWEQMVQELRERRANRKMMTATKPTGSATPIMGTVSMDFASLYPNTIRMNISMKKWVRKRSIMRIYA